MTDNKTDVPCPIRTLAVRSDGTIVRGLAATPTEARRWLEAVQTHGRRTGPGASRVSRDDTGDTGDTGRGRPGDDGLRPQLASRHRLDDTGPGDLRPQRTRGDTAGEPHSDNRPAGRAPRADRPRRPRAGQQPQDVSGIPRRPRNGRETPPGRRPRGPRGTALDRSATQPDGRDGTDRRR